MISFRIAFLVPYKIRFWIFSMVLEWERFSLISVISSPSSSMRRMRILESSILENCFIIAGSRVVKMKDLDVGWFFRDRLLKYTSSRSLMKIYLNSGCRLVLRYLRIIS